MRWLLNDLRAWAAAAALGLVVGGGLLLDRLTEDSRPLEPRFLAETATPLEALPPELARLLGDTTLAALQAPRPEALPNPYAGAPDELVAPGVSLPRGLAAELAAAIGREDFPAALDRALAQARAAVQDPRGRLGPAQRSAIEVAQAEAFWGELTAWGALLAAAPAEGPRPWALVPGLGQAAMGGTVGPELEGEVYATWAAVLAEEARDQGRPVRTFRVQAPLGAWRPASDTMRAAFGITESFHPAWVDLEGLVAAHEAGEAVDLEPFAALGRLRAVQLLAEAGRVVLVFGGHGSEVRDPQASPARFADYALDGLSVGEECQEVGILRAGRGRLSVRYGFCLDPGDGLVALSCSNAWGDESGPQHNTAAVAWLLTHGSPAPFEVLEPLGFRVFPTLQEGLRAAEAPGDVDDAVRRALDGAGQQLPTRDPRFVEALDLGEEAWLLRTRDATVADLLVVGPEATGLSKRVRRRLQLASTAWSRVVPTARTRGPAQVRESLRICGGRTDCARRLDHLSRTLAGAWPTTAGEAVPLGLAGRQHLVLADPNRTHAWLRLHVVPAAGEDRAAWLRRADAVARSVKVRRIENLQGGPPQPGPGPQGTWQ